MVLVFIATTQCASYELVAQRADAPDAAPTSSKDAAGGSVQLADAGRPPDGAIRDKVPPPDAGPPPAPPTNAGEEPTPTSGPEDASVPLQDAGATVPSGPGTWCSNNPHGFCSDFDGPSLEGICPGCWDGFVVVPAGDTSTANVQQWIGAPDSKGFLAQIRIGGDWQAYLHKTYDFPYDRPHVVFEFDLNPYCSDASSYIKLAYLKFGSFFNPVAETFRIELFLTEHGYGGCIKNYGARECSSFQYFSLQPEPNYKWEHARFDVIRASGTASITVFGYDPKTKRMHQVTRPFGQVAGVGTADLQMQFSVGARNVGFANPGYCNVIYDKVTADAF
ncbi:MAG: hypothetical protein KIT84_35890 [Labilithrix sp.]|nr:hypothetical protein [Labilithrix sp.]MCW5816436.1 hypothetical protein [Labilithrix sp.]